MKRRGDQPWPGGRFDQRRQDVGWKIRQAGAQDAAGLGVGLGDLVGRVRVADQRGTGGHGEPAVEPDPIAAMIASIDAEHERTTTWRVIGRGFQATEAVAAAELPVAAEDPVEPTESVAPIADAPEAMPPEPDAETVERVSRYNFDELSRILTDRVSGVPAPSEPEVATTASTGNALVSLSGETFILNRLPLFTKIPGDWLQNSLPSY